MNDAHDFVGDLFSSHEYVRVVLSEATHAEQAVQRAFKLVTMNDAQFTHSQREFAIAVRFAAVHHDSAGAVHGLYAIHFVVDNRGIHIVFIMIPVTAGFPQMLFMMRGVDTST